MIHTATLEFLVKLSKDTLCPGFYKIFRVAGAKTFRFLAFFDDHEGRKLCMEFEAFMQLLKGANPDKELLAEFQTTFMQSNAMVHTGLVTCIAVDGKGLDVIKPYSHGSTGSEFITSMNHMHPFFVVPREFAPKTSPFRLMVDCELQGAAKLQRVAVGVHRVVYHIRFFEGGETKFHTSQEVRAFLKTLRTPAES